MTDRRIRTGTRGGRTDWRRVRGKTEAEIAKAAESDADAALTTPGFWNAAHVVLPRRGNAQNLRRSVRKTQD